MEILPSVKSPYGKKKERFTGCPGDLFFFAMWVIGNKQSFKAVLNMVENFASENPVSKGP